jgi:hypothetical protein
MLKQAASKAAMLKNGFSSTFRRQMLGTPMMISSVPMRMYGNLSDQDRIFTNLYKDTEPWLDGAIKRGDWH